MNGCWAKPAIARLPLGAEAFAPFSPERDGRLEKRLEELNRRIDSLRQSIEELRRIAGTSRAVRNSNHDPCQITDDADERLSPGGHDGSEQGRAARIADRLVEKRLAACVQIAGPIMSVYRWRGKVESARRVRAREDARLADEAVEANPRGPSVRGAGDVRCRSWPAAPTIWRGSGKRLPGSDRGKIR